MDCPSDCKATTLTHEVEASQDNSEAQLSLAARFAIPENFEDFGPNQDSLLLVKSAGVTAGYLGDPHKTREVVRAKPLLFLKSREV